MSNEYEKVLTIFNEYKISLSREWLECCIEWCKDGNLPSNYTLKDLQTLVYQQWLFLDLKETEVESLPKGLSNQKKFILKGEYSLQMVQAVDISKPKHWQLQRIRNNLGKNAEVENDFGKRVLQLTLTDGVQEIEAMEYKPIPCLNLNLSPGIKIRIIGPVMVRNGRIMLESKHVKVLGGCVEENRIKYAAENVLARALNLEENPNPQMIDEQILDIKDLETSTQQSYPGQNQTQGNQIDLTRLNVNNVSNNKNTVPKNPSRPPEIGINTELESDFDEQSARNLKESVLSGRTISNRKNLNFNLSNDNNNSQKSRQECKSPDLFAEDMEVDEILNGHLDLIENNLQSNNHHTNSTANRNGYGSTVTATKEDVIILDDDDDDAFGAIDIDKIEEDMHRLPCSTQFVRDRTSPVLKKPRMDPVPFSQNNQNTTKGSKKMIQSTLKLNCYDYNSNSTSSTNSLLRNPLVKQNSHKLRCSPDTEISGSSLKENFDANIGIIPLNSSMNLKIVTIEKLRKIQANTTKGIFKIKAKFKGVVEKLVTKGCTYNIVIKVEDETGDFPVKIHSDLVEGFVKVSPAKIEKLKDLVYADDERAKAQIFECLRKIHSKIIALNNIVEIEITKGEKFPLLTKIIEECH